MYLNNLSNQFQTTIWRNYNIFEDLPQMCMYASFFPPYFSCPFCRFPILVFCRFLLIFFTTSRKWRPTLDWDWWFCTRWVSGLTIIYKLFVRKSRYIMKKQKELKNVDIQYSYSCTRQLQLSYILFRLIEQCSWWFLFKYQLILHLNSGSIMRFPTANWTVTHAQVKHDSLVPYGVLYFMKLCLEVE